jgi:hypothetical protein
MCNLNHQATSHNVGPPTPQTQQLALRLVVRRLQRRNGATAADGGDATFESKETRQTLHKMESRIVKRWTHPVSQLSDDKLSKVAKFRVDSRHVEKCRPYYRHVEQMYELHIIALVSNETGSDSASQAEENGKFPVPNSLPTDTIKRKQTKTATQTSVQPVSE